MPIFAWFATNRTGLELAGIIAAVCLGGAWWVHHDDALKAQGAAQAEAVAAKATAAAAVRDKAAAEAASGVAASTAAKAQAQAATARTALRTALTRASNEDASLSACLHRQLPADVLRSLPN